MSDKKRFHSIEHLDDDVPGLKAGAIVDADVTAEGLAQIDSTSYAHTRTTPKSAIAALEQDRTPESGIRNWEGEKRTRTIGAGRGGPAERARRLGRGVGSGRGR